MIIIPNTMRRPAEVERYRLREQLVERDALIEQMCRALGEAIGVLPKGYKEREKCEAALETAERLRK